MSNRDAERVQEEESITRKSLRSQELDKCVVADCLSHSPVVIYQADTPEGRKQIPACEKHAELVGRADCIVGTVEVDYNV